jgi:hypothetical protein
MDVQSQIVSKRAAASRARQLADGLFGDYKIRALVFAAELEFQADVLEDQLIAPSLPGLRNSNDADPRPQLR